MFFSQSPQRWDDFVVRKPPSFLRCEATLWVEKWLHHGDFVSTGHSSLDSVCWWCGCVWKWEYTLRLFNMTIEHDHIVMISYVNHLQLGSFSWLCWINRGTPKIEVWIGKMISHWCCLFKWLETSGIYPFSEKPMSTCPKLRCTFGQRQSGHREQQRLCRGHLGRVRFWHQIGIPTVYPNWHIPLACYITHINSYKHRFITYIYNLYNIITTIAV
jgi:hypothetical protein